MSLLEKIVKEMAAAGSTGAGGVASAPGSLFGGGAIDAEKEKSKKRRMLRRLVKMPADLVKPPVISNKWKAIAEAITGETNFDTADVISKLDAAEKKAETDKDTVAFGLEDEDGNIIKVHVRADQAEEFEAALGTMLAGEDDDENEENDASEIAEVIFNLKDRFEIVDVDWGEVAGDEEEEQEIEGEPEGAEGDLEGEDTEGELGDEEGAEGDMLADEEGGDEEGVKSTLQSVIDMMKSDAEARRADADARKAEANAKESEHSAKAAESKVRQEEEIIDMEAYYDGKQKQDKEAKQLAKLAKYKHDIASENAPTATTEEEETTQPEDEDKEEISMDELSALIFKHLRSN